jgi:two-component system heavy metal sensor histidine kinase CusS
LGDGTEVSVYMTMDQSSNEALLDALLTWALMIPVILALILAIGWWTVRRGLLPLTKFLKVASKISTESLDHRLPTDGMPAELKELADGINIMLARLDDGVQQLSQFSDDLAHELRAPLSNLMGKAQVALTRERSLSEYREVLESCTEELDRMSRMVSDMLFWPRSVIRHPWWNSNPCPWSMRFSECAISSAFRQKKARSSCRSQAVMTWCAVTA